MLTPNTSAAVVVRQPVNRDGARWRALYSDYVDLFIPGRRREMSHNAWRRFRSSDPQALFLVAICEGELAGLANGWLHGDFAYGGTACTIQDIYVAPEYRRRGCALALVSQFEKMGRAAGWAYVHWFTAFDNREGRGFSDRAKFELRERAIRYVCFPQTFRKVRSRDPQVEAQLIRTANP